MAKTRQEYQALAKEAGIKANLPTDQLKLIIEARELGDLHEIPIQCAVKNGELYREIRASYEEHPEQADLPTLKEMAKARGIKANLNKGELQELIVAHNRGEIVSEAKKSAPKPTKEEVVLEAIEGKYETEAEILELYHTPRKELQRLAKKAGIRANQSNTELAAYLARKFAELRGLNPDDFAS